jgi:hypothetical protein
LLGLNFHFLMTVQMIAISAIPPATEARMMTVVVAMWGPVLEAAPLTLTSAGDWDGVLAASAVEKTVAN